MARREDIGNWEATIQAWTDSPKIDSVVRTCPACEKLKLACGEEVVVAAESKEAVLDILSTLDRKRFLMGGKHFLTLNCRRCNRVIFIVRFARPGEKGMILT